LCCSPIIIRAGVVDKNRKTPPRIIRTILAFAIQRSLEAALVLEMARAAMEGSMIVYNTMFTPARRDKSSPAYIIDVVRYKRRRNKKICQVLALDRLQPYLFDTYCKRMLTD
jgi:hypothetical protein